MNAPRWCRHCPHWYDSAAWQGNCHKHPKARDQWRQDADAGNCPDYENKYERLEAACHKN